MIQHGLLKTGLLNFNFQKLRFDLWRNVIQPTDRGRTHDHCPLSDCQHAASDSAAETTKQDGQDKQVQCCGGDEAAEDDLGHRTFDFTAGFAAPQRDRQ